MTNCCNAVVSVCPLHEKLNTSSVVPKIESKHEKREKCLGMTLTKTYIISFVFNILRKLMLLVKGKVENVNIFARKAKLHVELSIMTII